MLDLVATLLYAAARRELCSDKVEILLVLFLGGLVPEMVDKRPQKNCKRGQALLPVYDLLIHALPERVLDVLQDDRSKEAAPLGRGKLLPKILPVSELPNVGSLEEGNLVDDLPLNPAEGVFLGLHVSSSLNRSTKANYNC